MVRLGKYRISLIVLSAIGIFAVLVFNPAVNIIYKIPPLAPDPGSDKVSGPILPGHPVRVSFKAEANGLSGIDLYFATYQRTNLSSLTVSLFQLSSSSAWPAKSASPPLVAQTTFSAGQLQDWGRYYIAISPRYISRGRYYGLEVSSSDATEDSCVAMVLDAKGSPAVRVHYAKPEPPGAVMMAMGLSSGIILFLCLWPIVLGLNILIRVAVPSILFAVITWGAMHILASGASKILHEASFKSIETIIPMTQMERMLKTDRVEAVFLGDSSCLMGISASRLSELGIDAQSYCTLAWVGPEGYSYQLDVLANMRHKPKHVFIAIHPVQFWRDRSFDTWANLIKHYAPPPASTDPVRGLILPRAFTSRYLVYTPLEESSYSLYYGGVEAFVRDIINHRGSAIDPRGENLMLKPADSGVDCQPYNTTFQLELSHDYEIALKYLRNSILRFGLERVSLILSPMPCGISVGDQKRIVDSFKKIGSILEVSEKNMIIPSNAFTLPRNLFSTSTHLNRKGQMIFTESLLFALRERLGG